MLIVTRDGVKTEEMLANEALFHLLRRAARYCPYCAVPFVIRDDVPTGTTVKCYKCQEEFPIPEVTCGLT